MLETANSATKSPFKARVAFFYAYSEEINVQPSAKQKVSAAKLSSCHAFHPLWEFIHLTIHIGT